MGQSRYDQVGSPSGERAGGRMPALHFCEIRALVFVMVINSPI